MTALFYIHAQNPQARIVAKLVNMLNNQGVLVLPTDSGYSLCCGIGVKEAVDRITRIRELDKKHTFTLLCRDFSEVSVYGKVSNTAFRFLKAHTPAPVTFILEATREVPKRLMQSARRTIGVRIPDSRLIQAVLDEFGEPLMSVSVDSGDEPPDSHLLHEELSGRVEAVVDDGLPVSLDHTTIVDLTTNMPEVVRQGIYHVE